MLIDGLLVVQFDATILRVGRLVGTLHGGLFLAEAHGFELAVGHAQLGQRTADGFCTLLAEGQVVFAATAVIGVAFERNLAATVGVQETGCLLYTSPSPRD